MYNITGDRSMSILNRALDGLQLRQQAISNNIANADTPNYKRKDVNFRSQLKMALNDNNVGLTTTQKSHFSIKPDLNKLNFNVREVNNTKIRNDRNNVDIDREMSKLAKNGLEYQAVTRMLSMKVNQLSNVINKVK
ncbi:flagellar basal body rod protein FlgB [Sporohalobacter salinus]|uniref:flagellar basal body rod protein FlgB n=1 Tax=Sporohalobacter salinus TaxID=1494606 RepID=UPI0019617857|nr:flagellar basal body rod protein FlgB [Sporohalobacter salinus]MBM7623528.1 flagellar basal-body rod protein FlgB [Sporohalobacter salinus]